MSSQFFAMTWSAHSLLQLGSMLKVPSTNRSCRSRALPMEDFHLSNHPLRDSPGTVGAYRPSSLICPDGAYRVDAACPFSMLKLF